MKKVRLCMTDQKAEPVTIIIDEPMPNFIGMGQFYREEADTLARALYKILPRETFDRLVIQLNNKSYLIDEELIR